MSEARTEEDAWAAAAAAADNGRGIQLRFVNLNSDTEMQQVFEALGVEGIGPVSRLRAYIERLKTEHQQHERSLLPQISAEGAAAIEQMAIDYVSRKRTIVLSGASSSSKNDLMDMLKLPEKGSIWQNRSAAIMQDADMFSWFRSNEDSDENRQAYMAHLKVLLQLPEGYTLADVQPNRFLLSVEFLGETNDGRKINGTTDVVIARSEHVYSGAVRNNIEVVIELKKPQNLRAKDHSPQAVGEHFAASYLNPDFSVVTVLTDVQSSWTFFWFAQANNSGDTALYRIRLEDANAAAEAKYILRSLFVQVSGSTLPATFANRISFHTVLDSMNKKNGARQESHSDRFSKDQGDSGSSGGANDSTPATGSKSHTSSQGGSPIERKNHCTNSGIASGKAPASMAEQLSLFAPPAQRDVANELDLLDMVDEAEQYEIVRSFALKYIVPFMRG